MHRAWPVVAILVLLALLSCEQKPARSIPAATVADAKSALVIVGDLPLWSLAQGTLTQKEIIPIGEKLALTGQAQKAVQSGKERDFLGVRRESGSEGWARSDFLVSKAILAVIASDNAVIYSAPANTAATTESIQRMTIVAIHSESGGMSFIKVTCFDPASKMLLRNVYMRNEGVASRHTDVQAAILLQLAAGSKSAKQKQAFLTSAMKDYPDSVFEADLRAALEALTNPAPTPAPAPAAETQPAPAVPAPAQ
jgi:hypothetical protein